VNQRDRGGHDGDEQGRRERDQKPDREQSAAHRLREAGGGSVKPPGTEPERLEEGTGALEPMPAEQAGELLQAVAHEQQPDNCMQDEKCGVHQPSLGEFDLRNISGSAILFDRCQTFGRKREPRLT
jgi:hypothetical protein